MAQPVEPPRPDLVLEEFEEAVEEPNPEEPDRPVGTPVAVTVKVPLKEDWGWKALYFKNVVLA